MIEELIHEVRQLRTEVKNLQLLVMKDKVDTTWLDEPDAAKALGIKSRTLRRYVKDPAHKLSMVKYRHTNGKHFQYSRKDILRYKELTSSDPCRFSYSLSKTA